MTGTESFEAAIDHVGELLDDRIGLRAEPSLRGRLRRSVRDEAAARGEKPDAFVEKLSAGAHGALQSLVDRVTVQESGFFRHPEQFEVLARDVVPTVQQPITIWSAACANGQEPYSLAIMLEELGILGSVVATDLSSSALDRTREGRYSSRETTGLSAGRLARHFTADGAGWRVNPALRARVTVGRHNLVDVVPGRISTCQVVFCRNVLIYFTAVHARTFLDRLADALAPGSLLFLGSAESLWQVTDRFEAVRMGESFIYRRRDPVPSAVRSPHAAVAALPKHTAVAPLHDPAREPAGHGQPVEAAVRRTSVRPTQNPVRLLTRNAPPVENAVSGQTSQLASAGQDALARGDATTAVTTFRKWVYLAPDDPLASLHLGLALQADGHPSPAQRAFQVARAALLHAGPGATAAVEGYAPGELAKLLDTLLGSAA